MNAAQEASSQQSKASKPDVGLARAVLQIVEQRDSDATANEPAGDSPTEDIFSMKQPSGGGAPNPEEERQADPDYEQ